MGMPTVSYKNHRYPPPRIAHAVRLYFRFPLSLRLVEEMLLERGIGLSYETIRRWGRKFGPAYAKQLRRKRASRRDIWHLDEVLARHELGNRTTGAGFSPYISLAGSDLQRSGGAQPPGSPVREF
jgi:hypothetical protein